MSSIALGIPAIPARPLAERRKSRQINVGGVLVGGDAPVSVQSMTTTQTTDINATLQQIAELTATGCDIVRVACPTQDDADALPTIASKSQIPVIADIHFQPKYVFAAIDAGCAAVRVNPGNIKAFDDKVGEIAKAASAAGIPIRIGVNAGSLDKRLLEKHGKATPEALVESALWECSLFEEHGFRDIKISVKHNDPVVMVNAYRLLAEQCDYPLHLGVTEAGPAFQGTIKSAVAFGALLAEGIGDTIRVSLTPEPNGDRTQEVVVAQEILQTMGLRSFTPMVIACPGCGRTTSTYFQQLAQSIQSHLRHRMPEWRKRYVGVEQMTVAVMGCVVNGPGESKHANIGISLPGSGERPVAPVYVDGQKSVTLKGDNIAGEFRQIVDEYVQMKYPKKTVDVQ
jgi:(E)-4-hydroxy-3-methylbut-2-enyl-diphosphate synthase